MHFPYYALWRLTWAVRRTFFPWTIDPSPAEKLAREETKLRELEANAQHLRIRHELLGVELRSEEARVKDFRRSLAKLKRSVQP